MAGRELGDYQVIKQIGRGALGTVFLAEHRYTKKKCMLKVLPDELAQDRGFIDRFTTQVQTLSGLDHSNIVAIHHVSSAEGLYFLVSDCIVDSQGETTNLAQYLVAKGGRLEEAEILQILLQVAQALDYAHGKLCSGKPMIHGGLKPNNILLGGNQGAGSVQVKLCDFGLTPIVGEAKVLTRTYRVVAETLGIVPEVFPEQQGYSVPGADSCKSIALHTAFLQTWAFMAPEQRSLLRSGEQGIGTDSYAFGTLAYTLLMHTLPEGYFTLPSQRTETCTYYWDELITSCLAQDPENRPKQLEVMVQKVLSQEAVPQLKEKEAVTLLDKLRQSKGEIESVHAPELVGAAVSKAAVEVPSMKLTTGRPVLREAKIQRPEVDPDPAASLLVEPGVKQYVPEQKDLQEIEPIASDMVVFAGGDFSRGSRDGNRDEMPPHQITLNSFAMDVHPVTNEQFVRFLEMLGGEKDHRNQDVIKLKESRIKRGGGRLSIESGYAKHPVTGVTWYGAVAYAAWVGKRLPTEAEWEIAACSGEKRRYPNGSEIEKGNANFFSSDTTAVMSYPSSDLGLFDMAGNVYEWCADWYGYNFYEESQQEPDNPRGPVQGVYRVLRGGCWKSLQEDLRCSRRHRNKPGTTNSTYGFRCAADVSQ